MARNALTIRQIGEEACWLLVRQALGIPDSKMQSDFMADRVALLLFLRQSLPERLCVTAAMRQMGGTTIFVGEEGSWRDEMSSFQNHLIPIFAYYMDCCYLYGYPVTEIKQYDAPFPVINAGSPEAHPAHALADICCMMRVVKGNLDGIRAAWIGAANGTLNSIMECAAFFPFQLSISLPMDIDSTPWRERAAALDADIVFETSPVDAIAGASFVYAGRRGDPKGKNAAAWAITRELFANAEPGARLLLSASPIRATPIASSILTSKSSMLTRQAEYRLRIHKRLLHWAYDK